MKIKDFLAGLNYKFMEGFDCPDYDMDITALCFDNRQEIPENAAFICISGTKYDTHDFAPEALRKGAACIIAEHDVDVKPVQASEGDTDEISPVIVIVKDTRYALSILAANWFGNPARKMLTIGITGTKGKSTTAAMIRNILETDGRKTGIIGTLGVGIGDRYLPTSNTTPGPYDLQKYLKMMVDEGCDSLVMEVSSQALKQSRTAAITFDYALFTNLEPDHIGGNEHADFEEYMHCKSLLFRQCRHAVGNRDDVHFGGVIGNAVCEVETFGIGPVKGSDLNLSGTKDDIYADNISLLNKNGDLGIEYDIKGAISHHIVLSIPGRFNIYNSLAAVAVCRQIVKSEKSIEIGLKNTKVLGRIEPVKISDRYTLMIDYAHNAMALESLLNTLREYKPLRLVCMFGCGGNRSKERRYEMGEVSSRLSDLTVVTSDNPRFEEPLDIINDILDGVRKAPGKYVVIPDRRDAIRYCIENAREGDMIILAGKGQEDYQEIKGVKYPMDERKIIAEILENIDKKC